MKKPKNKFRLIESAVYINEEYLTLYLTPDINYGLGSIRVKDNIPFTIVGSTDVFVDKPHEFRKIGEYSHTSYKVLYDNKILYFEMDLSVDAITVQIQFYRFVRIS